MELDPDVCYRALQTRDARFDGRFFTAVTSTGIYCRPICPARTPRRENCRFVPCAAAAQEQGFRPCLRCRPEASPGTPAWLGSSATVSRALRLIGDGALDDGPVEALAERLGVGERQLRRLFGKHLGASPLAVAQNRRVLFAKKLLDETDFSMTDVALASGFASVRRFNDAMRSTYGCPPGSLRRRRARPLGAETGEIALVLPYRAPFDWDALTSFLALRAIPGVEAVDADGWRRAFRIHDSVGRIRVTSDPSADQLVAHIRLSQPAPLVGLAARTRRVFDLGADPREVELRLRSDPTLRPLVRRTPGLRVPGAWDAFEFAVRAILGQQVTVRGATTLSGRLVERFGERLEPDLAGDGITHLFPAPEVLAEGDLAKIGLPGARAAAIAALAAAAASGELDLDSPLGPEEVTRRLVELPGIGPWTAQVVAMRALGEPDALPAGDLGIRRALAREGRMPSVAEVEAQAEAWRPWRAYAAMHLWHGHG